MILSSVYTYYISCEWNCYADAYTSTKRIFWHDKVIFVGVVIA